LFQKIIYVPKGSFATLYESVKIIGEFALFIGGNICFPIFVGSLWYNEEIT
jgi:hypothetical protein